MSGPTINSVGSDVDLHVPAERREVRPHPWPVLAVVSLGGALGAVARYGLQQAFPHVPDQFGWAAFTINSTGCLLIGVLMVLITELWPGRRLLRPFLGVGVLGGFTTFSTYVVDIQQALAAGAARTALACLAATVLAALLAVWIGVALTTRALQRRSATSRKANR